MDLVALGDFSLLVARWRRGFVRGDHVPERVTAMLTEDFDSPALIALAILHQPTDADLEPYVEEAFVELGLPAMSSTAAAWRVAYAAAEDLVLNKVPPLAGASVLSSVAYELDLPSALHSFVYLWADYDESPSEREWFDARIRENAAELLEGMPADMMSAPVERSQSS